MVVMTTNKNVCLTEGNIGYLTGIAYRAINTKLSNNLKAAGNRITAEQYGVLKQLWSEEGLTQLDLAKRTHKDKPGITRLLDNLEKKGFIKRKLCEDDRRCNEIYLTKEGHKLKDACISIGDKTLNEATENIEEKDMQTCKKVLAKICENLEEING